jgi:hypothetical protein
MMTTAMMRSQMYLFMAVEASSNAKGLRQGKRQTTVASILAFHIGV